MGQPKAILDWGGQPLAAAWCAALRPWSRRVVVVIGSEAPRLRDALATLDLVENPAWAETGMLGSLKVGLRALGPGPAWVTPVDVPIPAARVFAELVRHGGPAVPCWGGRDGHPVLLDRRLADAVHAAAGTLRDLLASATRIAVEDPAVVADFDDPASWAPWRDRAGGKGSG